MGFGKVQARGQVTIPAEVRQAAGIQAGDTLLFEVVGEGRLKAIVIPTHESVEDVLERYRMPGQFDADRTRDEVIRQIARDVLGGSREGAHREGAATGPGPKVFTRARVMAGATKVSLPRSKPGRKTGKGRASAGYGD